MSSEQEDTAGAASQSVEEVFGSDEAPSAEDESFAAKAAKPSESDPLDRQKQTRQRAAEKVRTASKRVENEPTHLIKLHNNPEIPPGGQYVGVNGRWIKIVPNVEMEVPESALEVLDNAVRLEPEKDEHNRVIGTREVPRFPYSFVRRPRTKAEA